MTQKLINTLVTNWTDIEDDGSGSYPGSKETHGLHAYFSKHFGLSRLGVAHHRLKPGQRASWPHAEADEDEFVFVVEGTPDVWVNGYVKRLKVGDGVGFKSGTGIAHTIINNSDEDVRLIVVGEPSRRHSKLSYPMNPSRVKDLGERYWHDAPKQKMGGHDGKPGRRRKS
jgi:uncharacterized cupin superfamily protein